MAKELKGEGGFWDWPIIGDMANVFYTAGSDMLGLTGKAAGDVIEASTAGQSKVVTDLYENLQEHGSPQEIVGKIDYDLKENYDYKEMERDALRHYLGMQALADAYGPEWATTFGYLNEGFDIFGSGLNQSSIDIMNNTKAINDYISYGRLEEYNKSILDSLLNEIIIPPLSPLLKE